MANASDRAAFSSLLALVAALTLVAFTTASMFALSSGHWSMWLIVGWSYAMALALLVWSMRDWIGIHWIGHDTLSMVAGASGTCLAAVALAFTLALAKGQDDTITAQSHLLEAQLRALERIEQLLKQSDLTTQKSNPPAGSQAGTPPPAKK